MTVAAALVRASWLDYPQSRIPLEGNLHTLVLIGIVFELHREIVLKLEDDQPVGHGFAASDPRIHNVIESGIRPPPFLPMGYEISITEEIHRRLNGEIDGTERKLDIELTDAHLCCHLANDRGQVEVVRYSVHL